MSKILAVFGATGKQGGSIIDFVLQDPELSQEYMIRAITRDVTSTAAKQLKTKVDVVEGDLSSQASLEAALAGVHTIFAMTMPNFGPDGRDVEFRTGKAIADAAVISGVKYLVFSTLPSVTDISGGKYTSAVHFDAKASVEKYIRSLPIKSAFVSPGFFMQNYQALPFLAPSKAPDGTWLISRFNSPKAKLPMIDAINDMGKFVGAILAEPDKHEGKVFCASTAQYTMEEVTAAISQATGERVVYKQIPLEDWIKTLPFGQDVFPSTFSYPEEFGYFGPDSDNLVAWAVANARGKPNTYQEYLAAHPFQLE